MCGYYYPLQGLTTAIQHITLKTFLNEQDALKAEDS